MKKIKIISVSLLVFLLAAGDMFAGGGARNGTAGGVQLLVPVGARGIGLGGSVLTSTMGVDAIYWNPANIARTSYGLDVVASHMSYIADIGVQYAAFATKVGDLGSIGLSLKSFDIGDIERTTNANPDGFGSTYSPQFITIGLSYGKMLSDRVSVGVNVNYVSERIDVVSASGFAFDVGVTYSDLADVNGLTMAVVIKNLGAEMQYDGSGLFTQAEASTGRRGEEFYKIEAASFQLPSVLEIGLGYTMDINAENALNFSGVFTNNNYWEDEYKLGAEYAFNDLFFLRGGYLLTPELDSEDIVYDLHFGAGLNYDVGGLALRFDYAYLQTQYFDANHIFAVGLGL